MSLKKAKFEKRSLSQINKLFGKYGKNQNENWLQFEFFIFYAHTQTILQKVESEEFWIYKAKNVGDIDHK